MKLQIFISQSTDFHFAKYRFSFRKVQIFISQSTDFISQSTDFHFAKYRFSFRKVQIFISQSTDFISFRFVSQSTISQSTISQSFCVFISRGLSFRETPADHENSDPAWKSIKKKIEIRLNFTS